MVDWTKISKASDFGIYDVYAGAFIPPTKPAIPSVLPRVNHTAALPNVKPYSTYKSLFEELIPPIKIITTTPSYNGVFNIDDTQPIKKAKKISEFPHKCPRCGEAAYVGINEIAHAEGVLDSSCR